jgi:hypothetical protein
VWDCIASADRALSDIDFVCGCDEHCCDDGRDRCLKGVVLLCVPRCLFSRTQHGRLVSDGVSNLDQT